MSKIYKSPVLSLLLSSFLWGVGGPIIKYTLEFITPFAFLLIRFIISSIVLYFFVDWKREKFKKVSFKNLLKILLIGSLGSGINLGLYFIAMSKTTAIEGVIIYAMAPIFVFFGGVLFLKEKETPRGWLGFIVSTIGFLLIVLKPLFENGFNASPNFVGNLLMLFSAITWALYALLIKLFYKHNNSGFHPVFITFFTSFAGVLFTIPFGFYEILVNTNINYVNSLPGIFYMAIASSVVAFFLYNRGVSKIDVSHVSLFEYLIPVITLPIAIVFLNEKFSNIYLLGFVFLFFGLYISERALKSVKEIKIIHKKHVSS